MGNHGERLKSKKSRFGSGARFAIFFRNFLLKCWGSCGLLGEVQWPWEALGAIFVEQRFGPNPPKARKAAGGGYSLPPRQIAQISKAPALPGGGRGRERNIGFLPERDSHANDPGGVGGSLKKKGMNQ